MLRQSKKSFYPFLLRCNIYIDRLLFFLHLLRCNVKRVCTRNMSLSIDEDPGASKWGRATVPPGSTQEVYYDARNAADKQKNPCPVPYMLTNVVGSCQIDSLLFALCYPKIIRKVLDKKMNFLIENVGKIIVHPQNWTVNGKNNPLSIPDFLEKLKSDFEKASYLCDSNAHTNTCPRFDLEWKIYDQDVTDLKYGGLPARPDTIYDYIFELLNIPFLAKIENVNGIFDALTNLENYPSKIWEPDVNLLEDRKKIVTISMNFFHKDLDFDQVMQECERAGYLVRSLALGVKNHRMAFSSCTSSSQANFKQTQWLFYDAQGRNMYMQGYYNTMKQIFKNDTGYSLRYKNKSLANKDTILILVKDDIFLHVQKLIKQNNSEEAFKLLDARGKFFLYVKELIDKKNIDEAFKLLDSRNVFDKIEKSGFWTLVEILGKVPINVTEKTFLRFLQKFKNFLDDPKKGIFEFFDVNEMEQLVKLSKVPELECYFDLCLYKFMISDTKFPLLVIKELSHIMSVENLRHIWNKNFEKMGEEDVNILTTDFWSWNDKKNFEIKMCERDIVWCEMFIRYFNKTKDKSNMKKYEEHLKQLKTMISKTPVKEDENIENNIEKIQIGSLKYNAKLFDVILESETFKEAGLTRLSQPETFEAISENEKMSPFNVKVLKHLLDLSKSNGKKLPQLKVSKALDLFLEKVINNIDFQNEYPLDIWCIKELYEGGSLQTWRDGAQNLLKYTHEHTDHLKKEEFKQLFIDVSNFETNETEFTVYLGKVALKCANEMSVDTDLSEIKDKPHLRCAIRLFKYRLEIDQQLQNESKKIAKNPESGNKVKKWWWEWFFP